MISQRVIITKKTIIFLFIFLMNIEIINISKIAREKWMKVQKSMNMKEFW